MMTTIAPRPPATTTINNDKRNSSSPAPCSYSKEAAAICQKQQQCRRRREKQLRWPEESSSEHDCGQGKYNGKKITVNNFSLNLDIMLVVNSGQKANR